MDYRKRPPSRDDAPAVKQRKKSPTGPPMTLGNAAAARVRLIVWCKACGHRPSPTLRRSPSGTVPRPPFPIGASGWCVRKCGSRNIDMVVTGTERGYR